MNKKAHQRNQSKGIARGGTTGTTHPMLEEGRVKILFKSPGERNIGFFPSHLWRSHEQEKTVKSMDEWREARGVNEKNKNKKEEGIRRGGGGGRILATERQTDTTTDKLTRYAHFSPPAFRIAMHLQGGSHLVGKVNRDVLYELDPGRGGHIHINNLSIVYTKVDALVSPYVNITVRAVLFGLTLAKVSNEGP